MHRLTALGVCIFVVVLAVAVGGRFVGGDWYQAMNQPSWNPPAIILAIVWAVLYVLMAVSAWMVWDTLRSIVQPALAWWGVQLLVGIAWSWMFFGLHRVGWALATMGIWLFVAVITTVSFRSIRLEATVLMLPVVAWLVFSLALGFTQWQLNGGGLHSIF